MTQAVQTQKMDPNNYFTLRDNRIIKTLDELSSVLGNMHNEAYKVYVQETNEFADWVEKVFHAADLASHLRQAKDAADAQRYVNAYILASKKGTIEQPDNKAADPMEQKSESVKEIKEAESKQQDVATKEDNLNKQKYAWGTDKKKDEQKKEPDIRQKVQIKDEKKDEQKIVQKVNITDADTYFEQNPVIIEHDIDAKKKQLEVEPLHMVEAVSADTFKKHYGQCYERLTLLRKKGFDTELAQIMLFRIPTKIKIYETSQEQKDAILVKRYLNEAIEELNNLK